MKRISLFLILFTMIPSTAFAQDIDADFLLISTTASTVAVGVSSVMVYSDYRRQQNIENRMRQYKQQNECEVQSALRLGGGVAVRDMGKILGLDEQQTKLLGKRLRANRKTLSRMSHEQFAQAMYKHADNIIKTKS